MLVKHNSGWLQCLSEWAFERKGCVHRLRKILIKQLRQTKAAAGQHHGIAEASGSKPPAAKTRCAHTHLSVKNAASSHTESSQLPIAFCARSYAISSRPQRKETAACPCFWMQLTVHNAASHVPCNMVRLDSLTRILMQEGSEGQPRSRAGRWQGTS